MSEQRPDDEGGRDPSEMFSVRGRETASIPTLTQVPLTPEEVAARRRKRILTALAIVVTVAVAVVVGIYAQHRAAIASARAEAESTGRLPAIAAAIEQLEGESGAEDVALAARLHAMAVLEGEADHRERAEALLASHDARGDGASDHAIALVYLALAQGDTGAALREVAPLSPTGPRAAEAARARALVASAVGDLTQAFSSAQAAVAAMPDAPRHRALLVEIAARAGQEADGAGDETSLRVARSFGAMFRGGAPADAKTDAEAAIAAGDTTPAELARAKVVLGLVAAVDGDATTATTQLGEASSGGLARDELLRRSLAEGLLLIGHTTEATEAVSSLSADATADLGLQARVAALAALATGNTEAARVAITAAPDSTRRAWVEGRIAAARGELDAARTLLARGATDGFFGAVAASDLATLEVRAGRAAEARAAIEPRLAASATAPRVAAAAALALSLAGENDRALSTARAALAAHEGDGPLLAALGRVQLASRDFAGAAESLAAAAERASTDATLHRDLGLALRELGRAADAQAALVRSAELDPRDAGTLVPLLTLQVDASDFEGATATLVRIDAAELTSLDIDHLRARALVGALAGQSGIRAVQLALRRSRRDGDLHFALGRLYFQAERWGDAATELMAAETTTEPRRLALLWRAVAFGRTGRERTVEAAAATLRESAVETPFAPQEEALLLVAQAWVAVHDASMERARALAARALELDPTSSEASLVLANVDATLGRSPDAHLRSATTGRPPSVEARGMLALLGDLDAERCSFGRLYLAAAPGGAHARDLRARIATCPR